MRLELRRSPALAAAILGAHGAASLAVLFLMRGFPGVALAAALLALGVASAWSRALLRGRVAVRGLELSGQELLVRLGSGEQRRVTVAKRRYVSRLLVTLPLGGRTLLVTADMLAPDEFRRLRLWALWGKLPGVAGEQLAA